MEVQENSAARECSTPQIQRSVGEGATGREAARPVNGPRRLHENRGSGPSIVRVVNSACPRSSSAWFGLALLL
jgi:hypothetical protein